MKSLMQFAIITLFLGGLCIVYTQEVQRLEIFSSPNCTGEPVYNLTESRFFSVPYNSTFGSHAVTGLWRLQSCLTSACASPNPAPIRGFNRVCRDRPIYWVTRMEATRFGDEMQMEKRIVFNRYDNLNGKIWPFTGNTPSWELVTTESYYFTGNHSWTTYSGSNYTGTAYCLLPDPDVAERGYGVTFVNLPRYEDIRSIREGCDDGGIIRTTPTPIPSSTTTSQGTTTTELPPSTSPRTTLPVSTTEAISTTNSDPATSTKSSSTSIGPTVTIGTTDGISTTVETTTTINQSSTTIKNSGNSIRISFICIDFLLLFIWFNGIN